MDGLPSIRIRVKKYVPLLAFRNRFEGSKIPGSSGPVRLSRSYILIATSILPLPLLRLWTSGNDIRRHRAKIFRRRDRLKVDKKIGKIPSLQGEWTAMYNGMRLVQHEVPRLHRYIVRFSVVCIDLQWPRLIHVLSRYLVVNRCKHLFICLRET